MVASGKKRQNSRPQAPRDSESTWPAAERWERIHVDVAVLDGKPFFVMCNAGSSWIEADFCSGQTATAIKCLSRACRCSGLCKTVVSDTGPAFISREFKDLMAQRGISAVTTGFYCPFSNSQAENAVRLVKEQYGRTPVAFGDSRMQKAVAMLRLVPGGGARISRRHIGCWGGSRL